MALTVVEALPEPRRPMTRHALFAVATAPPQACPEGRLQDGDDEPGEGLERPCEILVAWAREA
jgi:hypothetical protein